MNAWFPLHQVIGTFESGLRNRIAPEYFYQIRTGEASKPGAELTDARNELEALAAEYIVVHDAGSEEYYKDIKAPAMFEGLGPAVFAPTPNDRVYKLPYRSHAALVDASELPKSRAKEDIHAFAAAIADTSRPALGTKEMSPSHWTIEGPTPQGKQIAFSMNWDPGWRATQDGAPIEVKQNALGMILLEPRPAPVSRIELDYQGTTQQKVFFAISIGVWIVSIGLCIRSKSWPGSTSMPSS